MSNKHINTSTNQQLKPQISVVIPNYNGSRFLKESIDSALNQSGIKVEVIVVDDGSTDASREILESYGNKIKVFYQENKGAPAARNLGWKNARADFIKFLDSDDVLLLDTLKAQWGQINSLAENEIPYGEVQWTDENLNPITGYSLKPIQERQDPVHHMLTQNPLTTSPLHRRLWLEKVQGFDEQLVKGQEFDLHLRLVLAGVRFIYYKEPEKVYLFRQVAQARISSTSLRKHHTKIFQMFIGQQRLIEEKGFLSDDVKLVLGNRLWAYGRGILREGGKIEAEKYFEEAKHLSKKTPSGNLLYRKVNSFLGPHYTEYIFSFLR